MWWTLLACKEQAVVLTGTLESGPEDETPLSDAVLRIRDELGEPFAETVTNSDGTYEVEAPSGQPVFAEVEKEGFVTASFNGVAGVASVQGVPDGLLYGLSEEEVQGWRDRFAGCAGAGDPGGIVFGEVRLEGWVEEDTNEPPIITTGFVEATVEGDAIAACYLDEDGLSFDPEAAVTGVSGQFAIFGLPAGNHLLEVGYFPVEGEELRYPYRLWLPEGGASPRLPAFVELPGEPANL